MKHSHVVQESRRLIIKIVTSLCPASRIRLYQRVNSHVQRFVLGRRNHVDWCIISPMERIVFPSNTCPIFLARGYVTLLRTPDIKILQEPRRVSVNLFFRKDQEISFRRSISPLENFSL